MNKLAQLLRPVVSIVIPTYNQKPEFLRAAVKSALNQTFADLEVIVSDNHSTNDTPGLLQEITDPRLRLVRPSDHLPIVEHFAFAGENAKGEFISFLASDDLLYPDWLANLLPLLQEHPGASFGFGEIENVSHDSPDRVNFYCRRRNLPTGCYSTEQMLPIMMRMDRASCWMVGDLIRTSDYRRAGGIGRDQINYCADYALSFRLLELGGSVVYNNVPVAKNRVWTAKDGKVDARRIRASAADIAKVFALLSASAPLQPLLGKLHAEIAAARANKARFLALNILLAMATDEIDAESIAPTLADIRRIDDSSVSTRMLMLMCRPGLTALLRAVHGPALRFSRSGIGRKLLKL